MVSLKAFAMQIFCLQFSAALGLSLLLRAKRWRTSWLARFAFAETSFCFLPVSFGLKLYLKNVFSFLQRSMPSFFVRRSSHSSTLLRDPDAAASYNCFPSFNSDAGSGIWTIRSGSIHLRFSRSERSSSDGFVEDESQLQKMLFSTPFSNWSHCTFYKQNQIIVSCSTLSLTRLKNYLFQEGIVNQCHSHCSTNYFRNRTRWGWLVRLIRLTNCHPVSMNCGNPHKYTNVNPPPPPNRSSRLIQPHPTHHF